MAALMTLAVTIALTLYAWTTKTDFTMMGGALFIAGAILFMFGFMTMFTHSKMLNLLYTAGATILYAFYLIYDT